MEDAVIDIDNVKKELQSGNGWFVMHNVDTASPEEEFLSLMKQFGRVVHQNNQGDSITYIQDKGVSAEDVLHKGVVAGDNKGQTTNRPYLTNAELEFHTDLSDLAFLMCLQPAKNGGENKVVNSKEVYSYMHHHPDDLAALSASFKISYYPQSG